MLLKIRSSTLHVVLSNILQKRSLLNSSRKTSLTLGNNIGEMILWAGISYHLNRLPGEAEEHQSAMQLREGDSNKHLVKNHCEECWERGKAWQCNCLSSLPAPWLCPWTSPPEFQIFILLQGLESQSCVTMLGWKGKSVCFFSQTAGV